MLCWCGHRDESIPIQFEIGTAKQFNNEEEAQNMDVNSQRVRGLERTDVIKQPKWSPEQQKLEDLEGKGW